MCSTNLIYPSTKMMSHIPPGHIGCKPVYIFITHVTCKITSDVHFHTFHTPRVSFQTGPNSFSIHYRRKINILQSDWVNASKIQSSYHIDSQTPTEKSKIYCYHPWHQMSLSSKYLQGLDSYKSEKCWTIP